MKKDYHKNTLHSGSDECSLKEKSRIKHYNSTCTV